MKKIVMLLSILFLALFIAPKNILAAESKISDFESGNKDGWNNGTLVPGYNSSYALRLSNNANDSMGSTKQINSPILKGYTNLEFDLNLNGATLLGGDASAIAFDQAGWKYLSIKNYAVNGQNGWQHINIPLSNFSEVDTNQGIATLTFRFWNNVAANYDLDNIKVTNNSSAPIPTPNPDPTPSPAPVTGSTIADFNSDLSGFDRGTVSGGTLLLQNPTNGDASTKKILDAPVLRGYSKIEMDVNLNGAYLLDGDAAAIMFDQGGQRYVPLKNRLTNGLNGWQHVSINFSDFIGLNANDGVASISLRFWNQQARSYNIDNIVLTDENTSPTPTPVPDPTPTPDPISNSSNWTAQSIDSQVMSKYWAVSDDNQIRSLVLADKSLGAKQIAISINYDNYWLLKKWVDIIHSEGLNVWFRSHWNEWDSWEDPNVRNGITSGEYLRRTKQYILDHPDLFRSGDAFTMAVESENAAWWTGINSGPFNGWDDWRAFTRNQVIYANDAFNQIGLGGRVMTNWINMNGWVAWNELDQYTANTIGQLTLDHIIDWTDDINTYTSALFYGNGNGFYGYDQYYAKWQVPMMAGEWGYSTFNQTIDPYYQRDLAAAVLREFAARDYFIGMNYWIDVGHASRLFDTSNLLDYTPRPISTVIGQYYA